MVISGPSTEVSLEDAPGDILELARTLGVRIVEYEKLYEYYYGNPQVTSVAQVRQ